ncbi:hypothetical protein IQ254_01820 [Nodosilinea sp. LEGE 07088]|uniref:hypothetical protein n=1 Tax=Nodosilinea sp. LEGE 07088 TaxID=2777968 RepID=UPI00187FA6E8|nr:hypothetical protein [Nodosilinea sp. LEGE 07088]MBE9135953.1 hypothetical protein [Nodosilinea sp. LEGE 07088]
MKHKSKPLITGGLLGLAGLGLLPRGAEATEIPPVAPEPNLGAAQAEEPRPLVAPEPSAQITEPQTENQGTPQPSWAPDTEQTIAVTAAAPAATPTMATSSRGADLDVAASEGVAPELTVSPESIAPEGISQQPEPAPRASQPAHNPEMAEIRSAIANLPATRATEPSDPASANQSSRVAPVSATSSTPPGAAMAAPGEPTVVESLLETPAQPTARQPLSQPTAPEEPRAAATPELPRPAATPPIAPLESPAAVTTAARSAPTATAARPAIAPATRPNAHQVAEIRARAAAVQALMRDIRAAAGISADAMATDSAITPAPDQRVSQPDALQRGPQLPPLPSRSARRQPTAEQIAAQPTTLVMRPQRLATPAPADPLQGDRTAGQRPSPSAAAPERATANVALALPSPQPVMSSEQTSPVAASPSQPMAAPNGVASPPASAQVSPTAETGDQIRDDLRIDPITTAATPQQTFPPSPNAGIPSGFGANWGDVFISAALSGADRLRPEADGSLSAGFGLGDARRAVGVELAYNLLSVRRFGENGGFDVKVHRQVHSSDETQVAAAVGLNNFASYGPQAGGSPSSLYGVVTAAHLLQPDHPVNRMPITGTLGLGGGSFSGQNSDVGVIAGVGLQVHPQFSVNTAWSGVGLNVGASIVPAPTLPLTLNLLYGDIGNNTQAGSVAVVSVSYGFNFAPRF